jgi:hypothetical protein
MAGGDNLLLKSRRQVTLSPMTSPAFRIGQSTRAPFRGRPRQRESREKKLLCPCLVTH